MRIVLALVCGMSLGFGGAVASAESVGQVYSLDMIVTLALAKNPVVSLAEGTIEQQKGQQTAAGAYPNPLVIWSAGSLGDEGTAGAQQGLFQQPIVTGGKLRV